LRADVVQVQDLRESHEGWRSGVTWPAGRQELAGGAGVSSQAIISVGETLLFGECGFIVPAVRRGLSGAISLAKSFPRYRMSWFCAHSVENRHAT
jgi:hypothetical protein